MATLEKKKKVVEKGKEFQHRVYTNNEVQSKEGIKASSRITRAKGNVRDNGERQRRRGRLSVKSSEQRKRASARKRA